MTSIGFWTVAQEQPDHLALVEPDGSELRFGELFARQNRVAHGLRSLGLRPGDAVAVVLPNSAAFLEVFLACVQTGLFCVPINFHLTAPEIAYIVGDSESKAFIAHERFAEACAGAAEEVGLSKGARFAVGGVDGFRSFDELKDGQPQTLPSDRVTGVAMHYTSGTTGRPKGVKRVTPQADPDTYGAMYASFLMLFGIMPGEGHVHLVVSPLYHTAVLTFSSNSLHMGHSVVLMDRWTPEDTLRLIERYKVTTSHMVPTQFHRLLALPEDVRRRYDVSSLRNVIHSAAPCPVDVKRRMLDWWGPVIFEYYAATEGGGTMVTPQEWLWRPGTVGRPWAMAEIRILDDEGQPLPPGGVGTVWMKMGDYTFEYHRDPEKTQKSWRGGFFTVGDAGFLDEDGYLFLSDRKSDMIISGGVNIYPAEIEAVFLTHPKVADVAVFGIPDEDWGEQVKAAVELVDGVRPGPEVERELLEHCRDTLAKYKWPKSIDFLEQMPRDPNGKLYKRRLRDPYWAGRERTI